MEEGDNGMPDLVDYIDLTAEEEQIMDYIDPPDWRCPLCGQDEVACDCAEETRNLKDFFKV